jgi:hypothetical protein
LTKRALHRIRTAGACNTQAPHHRPYRFGGSFSSEPRAEFPSLDPLFQDLHEKTLPAPVVLGHYGPHSLVARRSSINFCEDNKHVGSFTDLAHKLIKMSGEPLARPNVPGFGRRTASYGKLLNNVVKNSMDQRFLSRKVIMQRGMVHTGSFGDLSHPKSFESLFGKRLVGGTDHVTAPLRALCRPSTFERAASFRDLSSIHENNVSTVSSPTT